MKHSSIRQRKADRVCRTFAREACKTMLSRFSGARKQMEGRMSLLNFMANASSLRERDIGANLLIYHRVTRLTKIDAHGKGDFRLCVLLPRQARLQASVVCVSHQDLHGGLHEPREYGFSFDIKQRNVYFGCCAGQANLVYIRAPIRVS